MSEAVADQAAAERRIVVTESAATRFSLANLDDPKRTSRRIHR